MSDNLLTIYYGTHLIAHGISDFDIEIIIKIQPPLIIHCRVQTRVVKAPFLKANLKAVSKRLIKAVKRLLYVVNMMNDCFKMHYMSVHLVVSNRHHDKTIEP